MRLCPISGESSRWIEVRIVLRRAYLLGIVVTLDVMWDLAMELLGKGDPVSYTRAVEASTAKPPEPSRPEAKCERVAELLGRAGYSASQSGGILAAVDAWRRQRVTPMAFSLISADRLPAEPAFFRVVPGTHPGDQGGSHGGRLPGLRGGSSDATVIEEGKGLHGSFMRLGSTHHEVRILPFRLVHRITTARRKRVPQGVRLMVALTALAATGQWAMAQQAPPAPQLRFVVVLDAAHGGDDSGGRFASGQQEKAFTLAFSVRLRSLLAARGIQVVTTRESDTVRLS